MLYAYCKYFGHLKIVNGENRPRVFEVMKLTTFSQNLKGLFLLRSHIYYLGISFLSFKILNVTNVTLKGLSKNTDYLKNLL